MNPWNVTEITSSICYALTMPADEREKRHRHNFTHVSTHTSQEWAETFVRYASILLLVCISYSCTPAEYTTCNYYLVFLTD